MKEMKKCIPQIGSKAPRFCSDSTLGPLKLTDYMGKWVILFSHPENFTPVSTTEIMSLAKMYPEFSKRNCEIIDLSVDSLPSHIAWMKDMEKNTGVRIDFPMVSDRDKEISNMYGMMMDCNNSLIPTRNVYFICPEQTIKCIMMYPNNTGRNIAEILRTLDALQTAEKGNVLTPANWILGNNTINNSDENYIELIDKMKINNPSYVDWYLCGNDLRRW